jgi:hypothetical protein
MRSCQQSAISFAPVSLVWPIAEAWLKLIAGRKPSASAISYQQD